MPKYVSGPGACGREIKPDEPILFAHEPTRQEKAILRLFGGRFVGRWLVKRDP